MAKLLAMAGRCNETRVGDGQQCVRPDGHPGECATSWGSKTVDYGHTCPNENCERTFWCNREDCGLA